MRALFLLVVLGLTPPMVQAGVVMYGGNGGHPNPDGSPLSINNGWLDIVDQITGAVTPVGHPAGVSKLSGLAFLSFDILYGSTINGNNGFPPPLPNAPTSDLVQINPKTGALISDIGLIKAPVFGLICTRSDVGALGNGGGNPLLPLIVLPYRMSKDRKARPLSLDTPAGCPTGVDRKSTR